MSMDDTAEAPVVMYETPENVGLAFDNLVLLINQKKPLREVQHAYVTYVLARHSGNKQRASRDLEVDRRTIQRWAKGEKGCVGREE
jgi:transcriptional regulator with PAS, ATPase and Fis domain